MACTPALKAGNFYAGRYQVYQDVRGEEFINLTTNGVTAFLTWNFTVTPTSNEVQNFWGAAYACYQPRKRGDRWSGRMLLLQTISASSISLKLRLIRATFVFFAPAALCKAIYRIGGPGKPGVPLRLTGITSSGNNDLARATVGEVYTQIIKDLNEAEVDLPLNSRYCNS